MNRTVLISGASIAGPALAYWLNRYGYEVTVVEKASALRGGGYPIDIRGTALEVVRRMGILPRLRDAHIDLRRLTFLDADGGEVTSLDPHTVTGGVAGQDLEVRRGDLADALHAAVRDDVEFLFDDSIDTLDQSSGHRVDVTFREGGSRTYDIVVGADGLHSHTRELLFGPEEQFHRYLGYCFAVFTMRNTLGLSRETLMWNTPGRAAALYAVGDDDHVHAFLNFARPQQPPYDTFRSPEAQRALVAAVFADAGWEVPDMLAEMHDADDLFFDAVSQVRMPRWSSGRVALVGDAAYAPSFLTGQGSSLALVGAYMLAASLADRDHTTGFAAYEQATREFVTLNQDQVGEGETTLFPTSARALEQRNDMLRSLSTMSSPGPEEGRPAHSALTLPEFTPSCSRQGRPHKVTDKVTDMSLRLRMRQALPEAMRARDKAAVSALRATLGALDNAEAVPVGAAELRGVAIEVAPVGAGATEAVRQELSESRVVDVVRGEIAERLEAAAQLTAPAHADRADRLRAEAAVLVRFLEESGAS